jgi:hypothetical protein
MFSDNKFENLAFQLVIVVSLIVLALDMLVFRAG